MDVLWTDIDSWEILDNTFRDIAYALLTFIGLVLLFRLMMSWGLRKAEALSRRSRFAFDDAAVRFVGRIPFTLWVLLAFVAALRLLTLSPAVETVIGMAGIILVIVLAIAALQRVIEAFLIHHAPRLRSGDGTHVPAVVRVTLSILLWSIGIILILSNLGVNVLSLVAGLGIGGIAVALAVQNILGDIFSSYSLTMDRPFQEGDFIVVGQHMGTVKKIGLKTTRLQALSGEEVVVPNQELTTTRVQNFKRMYERRVVLRFGVTYDTPLAALRAIPGTIKEIVESRKNVRFDRAHFFQFGDSSLDFEVVYFMLSPGYNEYMDTQQDIDFAIMEHFERDGISFAFPTRTIRMAGGETV